MSLDDLVNEQAFDYRMNKDDKLFISYHGKEIMIIKGGQAQKLLKKLEGASEEERQLLLAKATGNFKRGNESLFKGRKSSF